MKNVFLFIVLGLFTVGCLDKNPMGPEWGQKWRCVGNENSVYDTLDHCEQYCEIACIRFE